MTCPICNQKKSDMDYGVDEKIPELADDKFKARGYVQVVSVRQLRAHDNLVRDN